MHGHGHEAPTKHGFILQELRYRLYEQTSMKESGA
jgi:hypothetical protein